MMGIFRFASFFRVSLSLVGVLLPLSAQVEVSLPYGEEQGSTKALAFRLNEREAVSIGVVGADTSRVAQGEKEVQLLSHDPESRVMILDLALDGTDPVLGLGRHLKAGDVLYTHADQSGAQARVLGWDHQYGRQHLPFSFLRIRFAGAPVQAGHPLYSAEGHLVAIAHQATSDEEDQSCYAVPTEVLTRVLADYRRDLPVRRAWVGCHLDVPNGHPTVVGLRPESPASEAGVQKGDLLLAVGDHTTPTFSAVVDAFYYLVPDQKITFKVLRGMGVIELEVVPKVDPRYSLME